MHSTLIVLFAKFHFNRLRVVSGRLCFQVFRDFEVAYLARDLQAKFCLSAKVLCVTHTRTPVFLFFLLRARVS